MATTKDLTNIVTFQVGGKRYAIDLYDLDGIEWRDMKAATHLKQHELIEAALADREFDAVAAFLWVWRRRDEPLLTYEAVLGAMTLRAALEPVEEPEAEPDPPA